MSGGALVEGSGRWGIVPAGLNGRRLLRGALYVASIGLALHLVLPQIPGLERSAELLVRASVLVVGAAVLAEFLSEACYAELLGRSVGLAAGWGTSVRRRRRRGIGPWFALRLTVTGYGVAHVLPGGGATAATVTYAALRARGVEAGKIGRAVAAVTALVYGALGLLFAGSLAYLILDNDLDPFAVFLTFAGLVLVLGAFAGSYAAYRRSGFARRVLAGVLYRAGGLLRRGWSRAAAEERAGRVVDTLKGELRAVRAQLLGRPGKAAGLGALALGYWVFDALSLVLMFRAMGVEAGAVALLVAYGVATAAGTLPFTPGGIGVFETTMLAVLALLGVGPEATIPILAYRIFNFWLPIPLAALFYPTLRRGVSRA